MTMDPPRPKGPQALGTRRYKTPSDFDFKVLASWAKPATIDELAVACRAGLSLAVGQMAQAGVDMLVQAVTQGRALTADEGRSVHRKLASTAQTRAHAITQRNLIEVFMEHPPYNQLPAEDLCRRKDRLEVIAATLTQGAPPGTTAPWSKPILLVTCNGRTTRSALASWCGFLASLPP